MSIVRSPVRSVVRSPVRSVFGGSDSQTDLQRLIALSPSLLIWPAQGAGWQGTSGSTLAASGQPLGLGADLSQLQGKTLSEWLATAPELVTNGDFATDTNWTKGTGWTISGGQAVATAVANDSAQRLSQSITTVSGRAYVLTYTVSGFSGTGLSLYTGTSAPPLTAGVFVNANGTYTEIFTAPGSTTVFGFGARSTGTTTFNLDNVSIKELPGNHLRAGTWASPSDSARGTFQNNAINFDGVNDYYSLLNAISITTNMTFVRAFKRSSAGIYSLGIGNNSGHARDAYWWTDNKIYGGSSGTTANTSTGSFVLSSIKTGNTQITRLNGVQILSSDVSAVPTTALNTLAAQLPSVFSTGEQSFEFASATALTGADLTLVEQIAASTNGATLA